MEDPPFPTHPPYNSKRMFSGGGSGGSSGGGPSFVDADVIEIPPPPTWKPNRHKHNSTVNHEVIDVGDEDPDDIVIIGEKLAPDNKGKKPMLNYPPPKQSSSTDAAIIGDDFSVTDLTDISYDDDCVMLQAHFDNLDVPTGVEASVPWWPESFGNQSSSSYDDDCVMLQAQFDSFDVPSLPTAPTKVKQPVMWWSETIPNKSSSSSSFVPKSYGPFGFPSSKTGKAESWRSRLASRVKQYGPKSDNSNTKLLSKLPTNSNFTAPPMPPWVTPLIPKHFGGTVTPMGFNPFLDDKWKHAIPGGADTSTANPFFSGFVSNYADYSINLDENISAQITPPCTSGQEGDGENSILERLEAFKKFDTLEDHSGHVYDSTKESVKQTKSWSKTIAGEWRMLEKDLPETIFVRAYEDRMDLLRAVIVGADGTPYHDGLFFFDVNFTPAYPKSPPTVKYHAHGLRINPNLYNCGKVCLSLLGTWGGSGEENWRPGKSNMLQVLVSIQGLILNAEPYYNEPGFANSKNSPHGQTACKNYSENTLLLSLKTMLYSLKNPPKNFEDLVFGHFYKRAHDILAACRAYLDGVEVGNFDKGKPPAAQTISGPCSVLLKKQLPNYIKNLVEAFTKIGVKDCEKYLVSPNNGVNHPGEGSQTTRKKSKR
ncbi:hypothetical protein RND81_09G022800 [Saponaria officinalis]|uniref:E2 ubiquitin-conjugating enzyme n=1 Tax=Saponaria officinalis TaxID=3572 RepID=A0AAW1IG05_SAPOF